MAFRLLSGDGVEDKTGNPVHREVATAPRREDRLDAILRWVHRLLNPPASSAATAPTRRRVRDRVPI
jgi:hypothetical protein